MDCSTERIERLIDRELTESEASQLEEHLRSCAGCTAAVASAALQKDAVGRAGRRFTARPEFRDALLLKLASASTGQEQTNVPHLVPATAPRVWRMAAAVLFFLVGLGILFAIVGRVLADRNAAFAEIADIHAAALASANPVDVISTDRHTVKPWFEGRLPFSIDLPDLPGPDVALIGGRLAWFRHTPAAHIVLRDRQHRLSLFILPADTPIGRALANGQRRRNGVGNQVWERDGLRYILVGDPDPQELCRVAKMFGGC